ncbi:hypothetical protein K466DRAFT_471634, partial [Polyporus arcularius HHB13444]
VCREVEDQCFAETKRRIGLPKSTVSARANGRRSIRDFNGSKRWLSDQEENTVVDFTIDTALRGFPLNHKRLKQHVDSICRAKYGSIFLEDGVGKEWTQRFVDRHSERL